jgi:hypothetical protein
VIRSGISLLAFLPATAAAAEPITINVPADTYDDTLGALAISSAISFSRGSSQALALVCGSSRDIVTAAVSCEVAPPM